MANVPMYKCDNCGKTEETPEGWSRVSVQPTIQLQTFPVGMAPMQMTPMPEEVPSTAPEGYGAGDFCSRSCLTKWLDGVFPTHRAKKA